MTQSFPLIDIRDAFFDTLYEIAKNDRDVILLTADMGAWSLERFRRDLPAQFINMGIAEQNMVSVAAGLTLGGKKVFAYGIIPFVTLRCLEQIKIDVCAMKLPVTFVGAGSGLTYANDGPTHHAIEDMSIMRALPGMTILNPSDQLAAQAAAWIAYRSLDPVYARLDKGTQPLRHQPETDFDQGVLQLQEGKDLLIVSTGVMIHRAFDLAEELEKDSIDAGVVDLFRIKPLNRKLLVKLIKGAKALITLEEHTLLGGIGTVVSEFLADEGMNLPLKRFGINDCYSKCYGDRAWLHSYFGIDVITVYNHTSAWFRGLADSRAYPGDPQRSRRDRQE